MKPNQSVIVRLLAAAGVAAALGASASAQLATPLMLSSTDASAGSPINVFDIATGQYNGFLPISSNLRITGMAYDQGSRKVYILVRGVPTTQSLLYSMDVNPLAEPFQIGATNGAATNITSGGLAWDGANNRLIGNILGRVVSIDPNTATTTDIFTYVGQGSFNGLDIDPVSGSLYLVNNSSTVAGPFNGYGVYRIDPPYESSPVVKIKNAPLRQGVTETDIDGLAAGNGTLYLTTDEVLSTYRLNLSDLNYQAAVDQPAPGSGALVGGAAYIGSDDAGPDIGVAIRNDAENVVPPTGHAPFLVHVRNIGSQDANNVVVQVPLPGGTSFVTAGGGATFGGGVVSLNAGNLTPGQGTSFTLTLSSAAPFTATASATTTSADVYAGNNSASVLSTAGQPDLSVKVTAPTNCTTANGQETQFNIAVLNGGPRASNTTLSFPIPAGATFVSSSPAGVVSSGTVTINLGTINASATTNVSVNMIPGNGLYFGLTATATSTNSTDGNPLDNTNTGATVSGLFDSAPIKAFVSTVVGNANSTLPGMAGALNGTGTLDMLRSANGQWITADMDTDAGSAQNEVVIVTNVVTGVSSVLAQEGTTPLENGFTPAFTFLTPGVNNSGATSWSGRDNNSDTSIDAYAAKVVNGNLSIVAREGQAVPAIPGARYGATMSGGGITNSGGSIFVASLVDTPSAAENEAALVADGTISVAQKGITIPAGANGPLTDILNVGFYISADGTRYIYQGTTNTGGSRTVAVVGTVGQNDATAIIVSQQTLPGFSSPVNAVESTVMTPEGRWLVRGSNADGEDWVISGTGNSVGTGNLVMRTGPGTSTTPFVGPSVPITPGSTELWDPGVASATVNNLNACAANPRGDIVVAGLTNGDTRANIVVVLNGETVIAREGDPIDANGNGLFDDEMYLSDINFEDQLVLTNDACYALVKMRNREAVCTNATATTAWAVVRIPLPEQACPGDFNNSGSVTADDIFAFLDAWFAQNGQSGPGLTADVNSSGSVTADDIFAFLDLWFANNGSTCQ